MTLPLKQSTAATVKLGPFLDSLDGVTEETGLTISQADIRLSKNGAAFAQTNDATGATHDEKGYYGVPLDATDTNTLGTLRVVVHESGALPVWQDFEVLSARAYSVRVDGAQYNERGGRIWFIDVGSGNDANPGTFNSPMATFGVAETAASAGDTIGFLAGTYPAVTITKAGLTLDGYGVATISTASGNGVSFNGIVDITLRRFVAITTTSASGLGIIALAAVRPTIEDCTINGEFDGAAFGGATSVRIDRCVINGTYDALNLGGVFGFRVTDSKLFTDGTYTSDQDYRALVAVDNAVGIVENCHLESSVSRASSTGNVAAILGDGIDGSDISIEVRNCVLIAHALDATMTGQVTGIGHDPDDTKGFRATVIGGSITTSHANGAGVVFDVDASTTGSRVDLRGVLADNTKFGGTGNISVLNPDYEARSPANVDQFGGTAGTFTSGKPDVQEVAGNVAGSVGSLVGHTVQTGDSYARLGAPAGADISADIAAIESSMDPTKIITTTIATLASQTSFTLTAGSADDKAYKGCIAVITDVATPTQKAIAKIANYTGATKTVELAADPNVFTMAATDNITILAADKDVQAAVNKFSALLPAGAVAGRTWHMRPGGYTDGSDGTTRQVTKSAASVAKVYANVSSMLAVNESVDTGQSITVAYSPGNSSTVAGTITATGNVIEWQVTGGTTAVDETITLTFYGDDDSADPIECFAVLNIP